MKKCNQITAIFVAMILAFTTTACRQASAPSPEPTTTGGTDRSTTFITTPDTLSDVIRNLQTDSTIVLSGNISNVELSNITSILNQSNYLINLDLRSQTNITYISDSCFSNCTKLKTIVLPDSVTTLGSFAFSECNHLTNIVIPDNVTRIGWDAFFLCDNLSVITLPVSLTSIEEYAFSGCDKLLTINYKGTKEQWDSIFKDDPWISYSNNNDISSLVINYNYSE